MYRDDYAKAGFPMLPVIEPDGRRAGRQAFVYAVALLVASTIPTLLAVSGTAYLATALALGVIFAWLALRFAMRRTDAAARQLFFGSIVVPAAPVDRDDRRSTVTVHDLPAVNATLNALSAVLLFAGYLLIRARRIALHRRCMIAAFTTSSLFLVCYIAYHAQVGSVPFTRRGFVRPLYFTILITHVTLAAAILPLAIVTLSRGLKARYPQHRRIARWTLADLALCVGDGRPRLRPAISAYLALLSGSRPGTWHWEPL